MARRRLEAAIQAGRKIEEGKWPEKFSKIEQIRNIKYAKEEGSVYCLQFSYDGSILAVGYGNGGIQLYAVKTEKMIKELRNTRLGRLAVMCLRFNPELQTTFFATTAEGTVLACDIQNGLVTEIIHEKDNEINTLDFCLDGFNFATGGTDLTVRVYDTNTAKMINSFGGRDHGCGPITKGCTQRIFALKYHPDNNDIFVTGGWENSIKIWDARTSDGHKRSIDGPHICGDSIDFIPGKILTGSWMANNALQIWDYTEGALLKNVPFPNESGEYIYCCQFCDNDVVLAGGSGTNSVQAIEVNSGQCLGSVNLSGSIQALDSTKGGRLFATGGNENCIKIAALA